MRQRFAFGWILVAMAGFLAMAKRPPVSFAVLPPPAAVGVGVPPPPGAIVLFDGSKGIGAARAELQAKWVTWRDWPNGHEGEGWKTSVRNASPARFEIAPDPEFPGDTNRVALKTAGKTAPPGRWGYDDIEARPEFYHRDARIHVEWVAMDPEANSGAYVQNRYEIQILPRGSGIHGPGAIVDEYAPEKNPGRPIGRWQAYDIVFRAARWKDGKMTEPARMSVWWNGVLVHENRVVTGKATGLQNTSGEPVDSTLQGLKLQRESGDVRYRNVWMKRW